MEGRLKDCKAILLLISNTEEEAESRFHDIKLAAGIDPNCVSEVVKPTNINHVQGGLLRSHGCIVPKYFLSTGVAVNKLMNAIVSMSFISIYEAITIGGALFMFAGISVVAWLFFYLLLPETKGRTLEEIETLFSKNTTLNGNLSAN
ncbi:hypothetical protein F3Y22_tig00110621pilonHSYRG00031 [Hibiscus syriacus]|uniref:Uncharacterized protein n=1 Tax=Hibiscus syriacus TaxID=106335 RepID=A0A6A2ZZX4_HIBSY|nr:hypothetical protein F3Y22_tig00110621pilonHSYRG00031 [Hibiscus syriacus]